MTAPLTEIDAQADRVRLTRSGVAAVLTLARGSALNALDPGMVAAIDRHVQAFSRDTDLYIVILKSADPRAFCAGGDVKALSALARSDQSAARAALRAEYGLNWRLDCFSKPCVALIDGLVMGSGVGISAYATHRVAGPGYRFAMPETAIGFFPDVGVAHVLARMPDSIGMYLALTGHSIRRADALDLGLVTHAIDPDAYEPIVSQLTQGWPVDPLLDNAVVDPGPEDLPGHRATIARCFSAPTVADICSELATVTGPSAQFARQALESLRRNSPLALAVTHRHVRACAALDLRETLEVDYRLACRFLATADFHEGVRATLIAKDGAAVWQPAQIADVSPAVVEDMFAPQSGDELNLELRQAMQYKRP